jgi:phage terminase large subunit GpA-like protein
LREIPRGCLILTLGVDVQDDRIACQIVGWGRNDSCWIIDWLEIPGDPVRMLAAARNPALLQDDPQRRPPATTYVLRPIVNQFGKTMRIEATLIDSGHHTHDVYMYTRDQKTLAHLMAGKGASRPGRVIVGRPELQDISWRGRVIKSGSKLWMVGTDTAKHALYRALDRRYEDARRRRPTRTRRRRRSASTFRKICPMSTTTAC